MTCREITDGVLRHMPHNLVSGVHTVHFHCFDLLLSLVLTTFIVVRGTKLCANLSLMLHIFVPR